MRAAHGRDPLLGPDAVAQPIRLPPRGALFLPAVFRRADARVRGARRRLGRAVRAALVAAAAAPVRDRGVLLLSVVEAATWYLAYRSFNESGARGLLPTIGGVVVSSSRRTISRLLVLTVCLGYGVVRPTLGSVAHRVALLGAIYFAATATLDVASNTSRLDEYAVPTRLLLVVPVGVLDAAYFWWCFSAMSRTLSQLARRRQSAKLLLYRRFSHVLMLLLLLSGVWVAWQMAFIVGDHLDERWRLLWTFDAFWHLLYAAMLLTICVLWSPSKSNLQYATWMSSPSTTTRRTPTAPTRRSAVPRRRSADVTLVLADHHQVRGRAAGTPRACARTPIHTLSPLALAAPLAPPFLAHQPTGRAPTTRWRASPTL